jgi:hypothetical protein
VPMVGGPICIITPSDTSIIEGIRTPNKEVVIFFVVILFNEG